MSIGELATATNVKIVTIRYYEQVGLMPAPARTEGNYRSYNAEHAHRLGFIKRLRDLGFTWTASPPSISSPSRKRSGTCENSRPNCAASANAAKAADGSPTAASSKHSHRKRI